MFKTRSVSEREKRELCLSCKLSECAPKSDQCSIRIRIREELRKHYWRNPERSRATRRKENIPPEQYERKREYMRLYYQRNRESILLKQKQRDEGLSK